MKVKRQKLNRRHVRFYRSCFGFHEPFKVLCDGNFIAQVQRAIKGDMQDALVKLLAGNVRLLTTRCVTTELRRLGDAFSGATRIARSLELAQCEHETPGAAATCLRTVVGPGNHEHFFIASQDVELRKHLRKVPGAALIFARETALVMEPPSEAQQRYARLSEAERLHVSRKEHAALRNGQQARRHVAAPQEGRPGECREHGGVDDDGEEEEGGGEAHGRDGGGGVEGAEGSDGEGSRRRRMVPLTERDRPVFKRKRLKGPNPLSQLKKKKKPKALLGLASAAPTPPPGGLGALDGSLKRKRPRRKKSGD
eukprot:jgi/Mesen1/8945/ME000553S08414